MTEPRQNCPPPTPPCAPDMRQTSPRPSETVPATPDAPDAARIARSGDASDLPAPTGAVSGKMS